MLHIYQHLAYHLKVHWYMATEYTNASCSEVYILPHSENGVKPTVCVDALK